MLGEYRSRKTEKKKMQGKEKSRTKGKGTNG